MLRRFKAGQQEGTARSRHLEQQQQCSIPRVLRSALTVQTQPPCSCFGWKLLRSQRGPGWFWGSPGQGEEGMDPSFPPPPASSCAFWGAVFQSLSLHEARNAANKHPGTEPLGSDCCYGWGQQTSSALNIHPTSQLEVSRGGDHPCECSWPWKRAIPDFPASLGDGDQNAELQ